MGIQHLEHYEGTGTLSSGDRTVASVSYRLDIFQDMIEVGQYGQIPGMKRIQGLISTEDPHEMLSLFHINDLVLTIEDGQKIGIFIADLQTGRIANRTGFYRDNA